MALSGSNSKSPSDPRRPAPSVVETKYGTSMKFVIPSDHNRGREVQARILGEIEKNNYNSDCVFAIKLALEEAMVNAIKHGNKLDPLKKVHVEALVGPTQTEIIIEDEGPGFHRADLPDPTLPENLEKCSGRGVLLIEHYMATAEWTKGGRRLHMTKRND